MGYAFGNAVYAGAVGAFVLGPGLVVGVDFVVFQAVEGLNSGFFVSARIVFYRCNLNEHEK